MKPSKSLRSIALTLAVIGRVMPHPWNMTPTLTLSLLCGQHFKRAYAIALTLLGLALSDAVLALIQHHSIFGTWSLFTYTGMLAITALSSTYSCHNYKQNILMLLSASLFFWLWTNFGCWLSMPEYSKNILGLIQCYSLALPFLKNQLYGDMLWYSALTFLLSYRNKQYAST